MSVAVIDRNDVVLRGRLSAPAEVRTLPSGDRLVSFRLVVRRPEPRARGQSTDTLPCITYDRALQRRITAWQAGDVVEVGDYDFGQDVEAEVAELLGETDAAEGDAEH